MSGTMMVPVVRARAFTYRGQQDVVHLYGSNYSPVAIMSSEGRFRTHCFVRSMLIVVCELLSSPSMQRLPSQKADEMGPIFGVPSSFVVVTRTTGVPQ